MPKSIIKVALVGQKFMGKAHSNAYLQVSKIFNLSVEPMMHTVVGRNEDELKAFAAKWGWQHYSTNLKKAVADPEIDLVDIVTPNDLHEMIALEALAAGKAVACEKPMANTFKGAENMAEAARKANALTFVWFNYRRVPAVALARQILQEGRLGRIYHVRAQYLQDWGEPETPLVWRFDKKRAGSGAHGDLNAHIVDMVRFITGQEITEVVGMAETFIKERPLPDDPKKKGKSTVDDAVLFLAKFNEGAVGSFESTRLATGHKNANQIEINGEKGSLFFNFERMNELMFLDANQPMHLQGWTNILTTMPTHPYLHAWWPVGHILGYENTFVNQVADICRILGGESVELPLPDFDDALKTQQVLEAVLVSVAKKAWVKVKSIK